MQMYQQAVMQAVLSSPLEFLDSGTKAPAFASLDKEDKHANPAFGDARGHCKVIADCE